LEYGAKPGDEGPAAVDVTGTWTVEISAQGMAIGGTMNLSQDGSTVTGTINLDMGGGDIRNGQVSGTTLSFEIVVGGDTGAELSGTVTGSSISGTGGAEGITFTWTAKRDDTTGGAR